MRNRIPLVPRQRFESLAPLDQGTESTVYEDAKSGAVYKITKVENGIAGRGKQPKSFTGIGDDMIDAGQEPIPVSDFLFRHDKNNQHGGIVWSEWAAVTLDGDLVFKQPYIKGLQYVGSRSRIYELLRQRGIEPVRTLHAGFSGVSMRTAIALFHDDLHGGNVNDLKLAPFDLSRWERSRVEGEIQSGLKRANSQSLTNSGKHMSLTYQPFAQTPQVENLRHDLLVNVSDNERGISAIIGAALIAAGLGRHGITKWLLLVAGALLVRRGWTGHCACYENLGIDTRHSPGGAA